MTTNWVGDIELLHSKMEQSGAARSWDAEKLKKFLQFRVWFLEEEMQEIRDAESAEDVVDGLVDLCVVAIGTLDHFDVDAHEAWNRIQKANMAKKPGIKPNRPNPLGLPDMMKPEGWVGPDHSGNHGLLEKVIFPVDYSRDV